MPFVMREITHIFIHCTAGPANQPIEEIKNYWKRHNGWGNTPGYHVIVSADGTATRLQDDDKPTYGVAGYNSHSLHVCYTGGQNGKDTRTDAQKATLEKRIRHWHALYPNARILGHRDISPDKNNDGHISPNEWVKQCPSFEVANWLREIGI